MNHGSADHGIHPTPNHVFLQRKVLQFQDLWHFAARVMPVH